MKEAVIFGKNELKKHVGTIHSANPLSLVQRKISNALLFNAYSDLQTQDEHEIEIKKLCRLIGYDSNDHKLIKQGLRTLLTTVIEWNLLKSQEQQDEIWTASSMLASVSIDGPVCTYSYSSHMKKLLYMPSMYGRLNMLVQSKFKSSYGLALYENCIRYQNLEYSGWFTIEVFRKLMGVSEGKYKVFRDFKRRIIDCAVNEVNTHSNLVIFPELKKLNRKVVSIRFKISRKEEITEEDTGIKNDLVKKWLITEKDATQLISRYGEQHVRKSVASITGNNNFSFDNVKNKKAYLTKCLESISVQNEAKTVYPDFVSKVPAESEKDNSKKFKLCMSAIKAQNIIGDVVEQFEKYLQEHHSNLLWVCYCRDKFQHNAVRTIFIHFVSKNFPNVAINY